MKTSIVYTIIGLLMINTLSGQVKIGNNPQNLDPASVLELESTTRVLVITRVTDAQMSVINPLPGAIVYNTDQECLHYYNGTAWINICEELDNSFTVTTRADYLSLLNPQARDSTVVITQTNNPDGSINYNYEVGQITGANIVTQSINADSKIQPTSITTGLLAPKSVTIGKLADATGGQPGDIFQWNGSQWTLVNESVLGITEKDSIVGNEVVGPTDTTLLLDGDGTEAVPFTLDVAPFGIDTPELADDAVTTLKISDGNVTDAKLDKTNIPLSGFGPAGANVDLGNNKLSNVDDPTNPLDAVNLQYLIGAITASEALDNDTDNTNEIQNIEEVLADGNNANGAVITGLGTPTAASDAATKAYVDALDGTDDQDLGLGAGGTPNESVELTITDGASTTIDIRDADSDITNEIQNIEEVLADGNNANGAVITGLGTPTAASDAATKAYVDALDGTDDQDLGLGAGGTPNESVELTITDGASTTIDIRDADSDITNEIQNIEEVLADGNNANGAVITGLGTPTAASDAATKAYVDALDGTDDQDLGLGAGGTPNESVELTITDGASTTIDIRDADSDITNEIQNIEEVLADGNNANGAVITGLGTPTAASDAATKAYVDALDGTDDQDLGLGAGGTPNESVELTITDGASTTIDIRDADSDITNEIQNIEEVLADGNNANGAVITGLGTPTAASDAATKAYVDALDGTDDQDLGLGAGGTPNESVELTITDGASTTIDIRDADSDITNEIQNIEEVLADGNNANGAVITGLGTPTAASDAATKAYVDGINVSSGDGITVTNPAVQEFNVAVTNPVIATGKVIAGALTGSNAILTGSAGSYNIELTNPPSASDDYVVQLTLYNTSGVIRTIQVTNQAADNFDVQIYDNGALVVDADWFFTVTRFTP